MGRVLVVFSVKEAAFFLRGDWPPTFELPYNKLAWRLRGLGPKRSARTVD